jgi:hypothetical protein
MTMEAREELENASDSILRNNESDSIETDERDLQPRKQEEPIISTVHGMTIDAREELENASDSILRNNESDSIETDERDLQPRKQEEPRISTVRGMQTISSYSKYRMRIERSKLCKK